MSSGSEALREQYERFPYPSADIEREPLRELATLLKLFFTESKLSSRGLRCLDVGTGSGNRLLAAAQEFPDLQFTGIDFSEAAIRKAEEDAQILVEKGTRFDAKFLVVDILDPTSAMKLGTEWDLITCMGVLHHIPEPVRCLTELRKLLSPAGVVFFYVYGELGCRSRLLQKEIVRRLQRDTADLDEGIAIVEALGLPLQEYGWQTSNPETRRTYIVDALLNRYESPYTFQRLAAELRSAGFGWMGPSGITTRARGMLLRTDWKCEPSGRSNPVFAVDSQITKSAELCGRFRELDPMARLELIELLFQPNGYTVVAGVDRRIMNQLGTRISSMGIYL